MRPVSGPADDEGVGQAAARRWDRRSLLAGATVLGAGVVAPALLGGPAAAAPGSGPAAAGHAGHRDRPTIVLVHGAFADGSSWSDVYLRLHGYPVIIVQNRLSSLAVDVAATRRVIDSVKGPVVAVGHSYGGAVVSGATAGAANVKALVFVAAVTPDAGEPIGALLAKYPPSEGRAFTVIDAAGDATIDRAHFAEVFAQDVPRHRAELLAATQKPIAVSSQFEPAGPAGWRTIPSYFAVSTKDKQLSVQAQWDFARRMNAQTLAVPASHASYVSRPGTIAELIRSAARQHG